jgi:hypothetical protein
MHGRSLRRRVAFGLGRSRAAGPVGRSEASRLLLAGRPVHAGPAGGGALRVRSGCCCSAGEGEDDHCCYRLAEGWRGRLPLLPLPPQAVGSWARTEGPCPSGFEAISPGRLGRSGPQAWERCSRLEARGLYIHTHSVLTQRQRPAPRAARRAERHSSGRGPGGAVRHSAARARRVQAAGDP